MQRPNGMLFLICRIILVLLAALPLLFSQSIQQKEERYQAGQGGIKNPELIAAPVPPYTEQAIKARIQGVVVLQVIIRKDGRVDSPKILQGLGYGLDESAISAVTKKWKFKPGTLKDGRPVDVLVTVEINFRLLDHDPRLVEKSLELPFAITYNNRVIPKGKHKVAVLIEQGKFLLVFTRQKITIKGDPIEPTDEDKKVLKKGRSELAMLKRGDKEAVILYRRRTKDDQYSRVEFKVNCE